MCFNNLNETDRALIERFKLYMRRQWVNMDPEILTVYSLDTATNNGIESYHSSLKRKMPGGNTPIWTFVSKINDIFTDKSLDFERYQLHGPNAIYRDRRKKTIDNLNRRRDLEYKLESGEITPLQFLLRISYTFEDSVRELQRRFAANPHAWDVEFPDEVEPTIENNSNNGDN